MNTPRPEYPVRPTYSPAKSPYGQDDDPLDIDIGALEVTAPRRRALPSPENPWLAPRPPAELLTTSGVGDPALKAMEEPPERATLVPTPLVLLIAGGALLALAIVGLGVLGLRDSRSAPSPVTGLTNAAGAVTATAVPTLPSFGVPVATISFGYTGMALTSTGTVSQPPTAVASVTPSSSTIALTQVCVSSDALSALVLNLANKGGVDVDWWIEIGQTLPDGKTLWAGATPPYDTLAAGQTAQLQLQPDPTLCGQLIGRTSAVKFQAIVHYAGGNGQFTITDTIAPPPPDTATPTPTVPPTPIPTPVLTP